MANLGENTSDKRGVANNPMPPPNPALEKPTNKMLMIVTAITITGENSVCKADSMFVIKILLNCDNTFNF